ncbi:MAG: peptidoglycan DD-metalloendopeptidase family protein [candidate division Zixibacteria bacterium]|nr:peptidoglycan DD-metalloendopeptidase family protein [candidate division Zixibacteria bacterium]
MAKRYVNFLIVPEGSPKSLKFKLSFLTTRAIASVAGLLVVFVLVLSILHGKLLYEVILGKSLKQENERLKRYSAKVMELEKELREYQSFVQRVAQLAGAEYSGQTTAGLASYTQAMESEDALVADNLLKGQEASLYALDSIMEASDSLRHIPAGVPVEGWITQGFSMSIPGFGREHPGVDFAAKIGTEVRATADGKVAFAGWDDTYGFLVAIDHGSGYMTYYGHNSTNLVNVGDAVIRGQAIALSGNTGRSSAPHLHYEIRENDVPVNPENFQTQR